MAINDPNVSPGAVAAAVGGPVGGMVGLVEIAQQAAKMGISAQALDQAEQAAKGLGDAASAGQIRITPEGFDILMKALDECEDHVRELNDIVTTVAQAPKLGSAPYAQTVATHVQKGGTGQTQSADMVVQQLSAIFEQTRDALKKAKQAYDDNEHATVRTLK
jgi:hypothetical protein